MIARPAKVPRRVTAVGSVDASHFPFEKPEGAFDCPQQTIVVEPLRVNRGSTLVALLLPYARPSARAGDEQYRGARKREHPCHAPDRWARILPIPTVDGRK